MSVSSARRVPRRRAARAPASVAVAALAAALAGPAPGVDAATPVHPSVQSKLHPNMHPSGETMLVNALEEIGAGRMNEAIAALQRILARRPSFHLARAVYADLLLAKSRPLTRFAEGAPEHDGAVSDLLAEARVRLAHHRAALADVERMPAPLLQLAPSEHQALVVDIDGARLYVYENHDGAPRLAGDYYVSTGKNGARKLREGD